MEILHTVSSTLISYSTSLVIIFAGILCYLIWYISDPRVIDLDGKVLPGPKSMFRQPNFTLLNKGRNERCVSSLHLYFKSLE